jgi:hypothetical protein
MKIEKFKKRTCRLGTVVLPALLVGVSLAACAAVVKPIEVTGVEQIRRQLVEANISCGPFADAHLPGSDPEVDEKLDCRIGDVGYRINYFSNTGNVGRWLKAVKAEGNRPAMGFCYVVGPNWSLEVPTIGLAREVEKAIGGRLDEHPGGSCSQ